MTMSRSKNRQGRDLQSPPKRKEYNNDEGKTDLFGMAYLEDVVKWIEQQYTVDVLFVAVTGSHMWNLNTPDSDLDIRGIYAKPTEQVLSIFPGRDTIEACGVLDKNIDIQFYEIHKALGMIHKSNGNIIEMLMSPYAYPIEKHVNWAHLGKKHLSRRLRHYYKGYAHNQRKRAAVNRGGKALVYTYREAMAGIWLMRAGKIIFNFKSLKRKFEEYYGWKSSLLDWAVVNRGTCVEPEVWDKSFMPEWNKLEQMLDDEASRSILPEDVDHYSELNELLLDIRKKNW